MSDDYKRSIYDKRYKSQSDTRHTNSGFSSNQSHKNTNQNTQKYKPKTKSELKNLIDKNIKLSMIDTSLITDMSDLFENSNRKDFSGIEHWNVSNVTDMSSMFSGAKSFNQPLNSWNVSNVTSMSFMFGFAESFNQPLDSWNVSNVTDMECMFENTNLKSIPKWCKEFNVKEKPVNVKEKHKTWLYFFIFISGIILAKLLR
ncbi:BspA family leucine-rich repeat surface protein [Helicobacter sp. 23-1044]